MKKGQPVDQVVLEGSEAIQNLLIGGLKGRVEYQHRMSVQDFSAALVECCVAQKRFSLGLAPHGMLVRDVHQRNGMFVFLIEEPPGVRTLQWLQSDSPAQYGPSATYRNVSIALPWVYFFVTVSADGCLGDLNSVYFRNAALRSLHDPLCEPHFYNCSVDAYGTYCWICTQYDQREKGAKQSFFEFVDGFIERFWCSGFNASSEAHEGASFWGKNRRLIPDERVRTIEAWEQASACDSTFVLSVPWIRSGYTPLSVYYELTAVGTPWRPASAREFATLIQRCAKED